MSPAEGDCRLPRMPEEGDPEDADRPPTHEDLFDALPIEERGRDWWRPDPEGRTFKGKPFVWDVK